MLGRIPNGTQLNHMYEITRFINRGGMGEVYEGINIHNDERVAIKLILDHLAEDDQMKQLFRRESLTLSSLNHPALVQYRTAATDRDLGVFYIVMAYVDGVGLDDQIETALPPVPELIGLMRWLALGLGAAHREGVFHRDISPDNIILENGRFDRAKIIDFGIAKGVGKATVIGPGGFGGKLQYVAPEQIGLFDPDIGPWTDIYSLGLVMLALSSGRRINMGSNPVEAVDRRRAGVDLSGAPPVLRPVFASMLAIEPKDRFQTTEELVEALDRVFDTGPAPRRTNPPVPTTAFFPQAPKASTPPKPAPAAAPAKAVKPPAKRPAPAKAAKPVQPPAPPPPQRSGVVAPWMIGAVAVVVLVLAGGAGLLLLAPHARSPDAGSQAAGPAATVEALLDPPLREVRCGWPTVQAPSPDAPSSYAINGRALDPAAANEVLQTAASAGQSSAAAFQVSPQLIGGVTSAQCPALEALSAARAPMSSEDWIKADNPRVVQAATPDCDNDPRKGAAVVDGRLPAGGEDQMILVGPDGAVASVFAGREGLRTLARRAGGAFDPQSGEFRITVCLARPGLNFIGLAHSRTPLHLDLPGGSRAGEASAFASSFRSGAQSSGAKVQGVWFELQPGAAAPTPAAPQALAPAPAPQPLARPPRAAPPHRKVRPVSHPAPARPKPAAEPGQPVYRPPVRAPA
ncbi:MAG TPA: serine/threonine-protein kinase [Caulobacteraceae bacterium]|jgi:serine/threonine-protein kinase|nr:serine/threonine-protein kinase [Caulobacteraceae bacterium]